MLLEGRDSRAVEHIAPAAVAQTALLKIETKPTQYLFNSKKRAEFSLFKLRSSKTRIHGISFPIDPEEALRLRKGEPSINRD